MTLKKALSMKAGDAIIYDHKLFHGSPANLKSTSRLAINLAMIPQETQSLHYHLKL
jgi:ectoine hydroxylase-related dioxygenase (phytanoyl-CoA dioxygenase family)